MVVFGMSVANLIGECLIVDHRNDKDANTAVTQLSSSPYWFDIYKEVKDTGVYILLTDIITGWKKKQKKISKLIAVLMEI